MRGALSAVVAALLTVGLLAQAPAGASTSSKLEKWGLKTGAPLANRFLADIKALSHVNSKTSISTATKDCVKPTRDSLNASIANKPPPGAGLASLFNADLKAIARGFSECTTSIDSVNASGITQGVKIGDAGIGALLRLIENAEGGRTTRPPPTTTTIAPPQPQTLQSQSGSGQSSLAQFTVPSSDKGWQINWTYDCSNFGGSGNFAISITGYGSAANTIDEGTNQLGASGSSTDHYYDTGTFNLMVNSECNWTLAVVTVP